MSMNNSLADLLPEVKTGTTIPRLIHQMYPVEDLPEALARNVRDIVEDHPEWEHRLYDNESALAYVEANYGPDIARIVARIAPEYGVARSDLFRYLVIYRDGGVYLDIKSRPEIPLDQIIAAGDTLVTSHWGGDEFRAFGRHRELKHVPAGELQQWHIIAVAGHPILREVILHVLENVTSYSPWRLAVGKPGVLRTTGPIAYTLAVMASGQDGVRIARSHRELGLRYSVVDDHKVYFANHYSSLRTPLIAPEKLSDYDSCADHVIMPFFTPMSQPCRIEPFWRDGLTSGMRHAQPNRRRSAPSISFASSMISHIKWP